MGQEHDPFAHAFDSIELDPARAPRRDAIERAMATIGPRPPAPPQAAPGFALLDDCGGRFVIDRELGIVSLSDETWLTREAGAVHTARLRVVEASGASYEMDMPLRLTGMVPRVVGAEEIDFLAGAPALTAPTPAPQKTAIAQTWAGYAISAAHAAKAPLAGDEAAPYGALIPARPLPDTREAARLHIYAELPRPAPAGADWSL